MKLFRNRLTLIMLTLIGLSMLGAGLAMANVFKQSHIKLQEENLIREINLIQGTLPFPPLEGKERAAYYTEKSLRLEELADARVTFIARDGTVIGDSEGDPSTMDNHALREELVQAEREGTGMTVRYSNTLGENMIYVARPVKQGAYDGYIRLSMSLSRVEEGVRQGWMVIIGGLAVLFAVGSLISYRIAAGLTSPLEKITRVARQITRLDYNARVKLQRDDEIGHLAHAINGMADSLQTQLRTIRENEDMLQSVLNNMTGGVVMLGGDGTVVLVNRAAEKMLGVKALSLTGRSYRELKQHPELIGLMEEGLKERHHFREERTLHYPAEMIIRLDGVQLVQDDGIYRGMLFHLQDVTDIRRLERVRSEFVANVSHELKTPLAAVKGFAETLIAGVEDEQTSKAFLQIIYDESERLNRLIRDILELSGIESKRNAMEYSPVHLGPFFESLRKFLEAEAEKKGITLEVEVPEELFIEGDEDKLRQIFTNLVSNAISYTPEGGRVQLAASEYHSGEHGDTIRFVVRDTGIGIPKKDLPRIFERFYRVDKARSRGSGGTGLGLSIVKHLVEMHHGTIKVESEMGMGTVFTVELPVVQEYH